MRKEQIVKKTGTKLIFTFLIALLLFPSGFFGIAADNLTVQASQKQAQTTEYFNEDEKEQRTILWVDGITPPKMGGDHSDFQKEITNVNQIQYIEYKTPYLPGNGWYDVNKSEDRDQDANLCFAAAAANGLHWWMAQNDVWIDRYLNRYPELPQAQKIRKYKQALNSQYGSEIYGQFVRQFANRKEGYWSDILQDQFINGYYPKQNGGVNDPDFDGSDLLTKGPDPRGGIFYDVFGTKTMTQRHYYDYYGTSYADFGRDVQRYLNNGALVTMTYDMVASAHVVTLWGAEYNSSGQITAVYFSDSDDDKKYGMQRYRVINKNGRPCVTTNNAGTGSFVSCITALSPGTEIWKTYMDNSKLTLDLQWGDTTLVYTGKKQTPTVKATNIAAGDDVILTVTGGGTNVGVYTAQAELSGRDADKYKLPGQPQTSFTIRQSAASFGNSLKIYRGEEETAFFRYGDTITVTVTPKLTGTAPSFSLFTGINAGQTALYMGDRQLTNAVSADASDKYTMRCTATETLFHPGDNRLSVHFKGNANVADHQEDMIITLYAPETPEKTYTPVAEVPSSCETDGTKAHFTDQEGKLYIEENGIKKEVTKQDLRIPASHRTGNWIPEVPATETKEGWAGHYTCQTCHKHLGADKKTVLTTIVLPAKKKHPMPAYPEQKPASPALPITLRIHGLSHQLAAGKKVALTVSSHPAAPFALRWTSSNPKAATVNSNGVVSLKKKAGGKTVTITASTIDGRGIRASWKIKIRKGHVPKIMLSGVHAIRAGKAGKLTATIKATTGANRKLKWSSSNPAFASVSSNGLVRTKKAGKGKTVKITAMATDGTNRKKTIKIRIK